jgi:hypothetical protein
MTSQERVIVVAFLKALKELPESKKEYLLGFAESAAIMKEHPEPALVQ